jgi:mRNA interferase HicA
LRKAVVNFLLDDAICTYICALNRTAAMPPILELNRQKIASRLEREGWTARHGKQHDVYAHPEKPHQIITLPRHRTVSPGVARNTAKTPGWI